jgi:hypothetical protein
MYQYKDISALTRVAVAALWVFMLTKLLFEGLTFYARSTAAGPLSPGLAGTIGLTAVVELLGLLGAFILVGCWIYRASANAHAIGGDLTVTPGWAVGWYFVPFANLVKPFHAMKETWLASHYGSDWGRGDATDLLNWWWGLWLVSNIIDNIDWRLGADLPAFGLVAGAMGVPLNLVLIRLMKQIRDGQKVVRHAEVFA